MAQVRDELWTLMGMNAGGTSSVISHDLVADVPFQGAVAPGGGGITATLSVCDSFVIMALTKEMSLLMPEDVLGTIISHAH